MRHYARTDGPAALSGETSGGSSERQSASVNMSTELSRVAELADRLADRTLVAFEQGALSTEEFRASADVALVLDAARLLHAAGAEFPAGVVRLAQKAAEQTQL
jgi:hypothetical protein